MSDFHTRTLHVSGAETATGTGTPTPEIPFGVDGVTLALDVTAAATDASDVLDVYVQTKVNGTDWVDVCHFTQIAGNGGAKTYIDKIAVATGVTAFETGAALGAAAQRDLIGTEWRCRWTITDAGTLGAASFTFSVVIQPM